MGIKKYAVEPTTRLHLRGADDELLYADGEDGKPDESKPMVAVLYGPGSKPYEKATTERSNRMVDRLKKKGKTETSPEQSRKENVDFLAAVTVSFENVVYDDNPKLIGDALHRAVYADITIGFIAEQVSKHTGDWGNFSKPSTTT